MQEWCMEHPYLTFFIATSAITAVATSIGYITGSFRRK